jgi:hypothetical protein
MKKRIMDLLDGGNTQEALCLLADYMEQKGFVFETKMEPWKITRADEVRWERPLLYIGLIRHPGGLRRQRWVYDFDNDEMTLISEGPIPLSRPYKAQEDAIAIVKAIITDSNHPCIIKKGDLFVINPRKIPELVSAPKQTVEGRVRRLKSCIRDSMKAHSEFEEASYRNMLAYRKKDQVRVR